MGDNINLGDSEWRTHSNAMDWRREWRLFDGRSGEPLFTTDSQSSLWLPGRECPIAEAIRPFAAFVDEAHYPGPGDRLRCLARAQ